MKDVKSYVIGFLTCASLVLIMAHDSNHSHGGYGGYADKNHSHGGYKGYADKGHTHTTLKTSMQGMIDAELRKLNAFSGKKSDIESLEIDIKSLEKRIKYLENLLKEN